MDRGGVGGKLKLPPLCTNNACSTRTAKRSIGPCRTTCSRNTPQLVSCIHDSKDSCTCSTGFVHQKSNENSLPCPVKDNSCLTVQNAKHSQCTSSEPYSVPATGKPQTMNPHTPFSFVLDNDPDISEPSSSQHPQNPNRSLQYNLPRQNGSHSG